MPLSKLRKPLKLTCFTSLSLSGVGLLAMLLASGLGVSCPSSRIAAAELKTAPAEKPAPIAKESDHRAAIEIDARIAKEAEFLASDKLEGRGIETQGINLAADYLGKQFAEMGLKTKLYDGTPFQRFSITTSSKLGP
ncbi:MAG: hypothetical protein K8T25_14220, partial [Planctomycetia bacterium]|nr:hypothetical protein [Planctomycetia bacterium]